MGHFYLFENESNWNVGHSNAPVGYSDKYSWSGLINLIDQSRFMYAFNNATAVHQYIFMIVRIAGGSDVHEE